MRSRAGASHRSPQGSRISGLTSARVCSARISAVAIAVLLGVPDCMSGLQFSRGELSGAAG